MFFSLRTRDSDNDTSDLERRSRKDRDGESSKSKKKHKKHKKNKKSKKSDSDGKTHSSSKKHKKHHKRSKSSDGNSSEPTIDTTPVKTKSDKVQSSRHESETKLPPQSTTIVTATATTTTSSLSSTSTSTLNTKFTEIMKSNGHVVTVQAPISKSSHRNGADSSKKEITSSTSTKIPTDPNKLVEFITKSLDANTSAQVVSSASDSDTVRDVDSPDVAVIEEDDLNLEELMRQKALLQARLGGIVASDTESENSRKTPAVIDNKIVIDIKNQAKTKLKRAADTVGDVILLDDSSNEATEKPSPPKKKVRNSRSKSRERVQHKERSGGNSRNNRESRDNNDKSSKSRRSDVENRFKEDLRREIDRDKERSGRNSPKPSQRQSSQKTGQHSPNSKSRLSTSDRNDKNKPPSMMDRSAMSSFANRDREVN